MNHTISTAVQHLWAKTKAWGYWGSSAALSVTLLAAPAGQCTPPEAYFESPGPYATTVENNTGPGSAYTVFRPANLGEGGVRHPIITWGNGTFVTPAAYASFLTHLASHGFVVVAPNTTNTGTGIEMINGVAWLIQENGTAGSRFQGKLDPSQVGATGHSQGGGGTMRAGFDDRIKTVAPLEPIYVSPSQLDAGDTMFVVCGGQDTTIPPSICQRMYSDSARPTFYGLLEAANHITPLNDAGAMRGPVTAWFYAQLKNNQDARNFFYGPSCTLCTDEDWTVQRKNGF